MKAITIHQPWATLIALGEKRFETRGWPTKYRGELAIHAGKSIDMSALLVQEIKDALVRNGITDWTKLPYGVVMATATLTECWSVGSDYQSGMPVLYNGEGGETRPVRLKEGRFGDYSFGRYAWELIDVRPLPEPIQAKGQQRLWNWEPAPKLGTIDDVFALIRTMPDQDRFRALGIFNRMQTKRISVQQAMEELKELFFKNGIFEPE